MLAKLGQSELLKRRPRYQLECNSINLSVPIFPGTTLTIGSHSSDSILVSEKDIKPKHVQLKLLEDSSELGINALLGQVESRVELGTSVFRLIPSQIEFVIKALGQ